MITQELPKISSYSPQLLRTSNRLHFFYACIVFLLTFGQITGFGGAVLSALVAVGVSFTLPLALYVGIPFITVAITLGSWHAIGNFLDARRKESMQINSILRTKAMLAMLDRSYDSENHHRELYRFLLTLKRYKKAELANLINLYRTAGGTSLNLNDLNFLHEKLNKPKTTTFNALRTWAEKKAQQENQIHGIIRWVRKVCHEGLMTKTRLKDYLLKLADPKSNVKDVYNRYAASGGSSLTLRDFQYFSTEIKDQKTPEELITSWAKQKYIHEQEEAIKALKAPVPLFSDRVVNPAKAAQATTLISISVLSMCGTIVLGASLVGLSISAPIIATTFLGVCLAASGIGLGAAKIVGDLLAKSSDRNDIITILRQHKDNLTKTNRVISNLESQSGFINNTIESGLNLRPAYTSQSNLIINPTLRNLSDNTFRFYPKSPRSPLHVKRQTKLRVAV